MLIKNAEYETKILRYGCNAEGIAEIEGMVVFVPYALAEETIRVKILKVLKSYAYGKIVEIIKPSFYRVIPKCEVYYKCGGCSLLHTSYENQLIIKKEILKSALKGIWEKDFEIVASKQFGYRNKLQIPVREVNGKPECGFYRENSHDITPISKCLLQSEVSAKLIAVVKEFMTEYKISAYNEITGRGVVRHIVSREFGSKIAIVIVINANKLPNADKLVEKLKKIFPDFSLFINIHKEKTNVVCSDCYIKIYGNDKLTGEMNFVKLEISPQSFLQVNIKTAARLYSDAYKLINGDIVIDAYSGIGVLSAMLSKKAKYVFGIEIVPEAVKNANKLIELNGISNVFNIVGDCAECVPVLSEFIKSKKKFKNPPFNLPANMDIQLNDKLVFVVDPPRKGLNFEVIKTVIESKADNIIYISCNPATLARDLKLLEENYKTEFLTAYDMFPNSKHLETLVLLSRK